MLDGKDVSKAYFGILKDVINMPHQTEPTVFEEQIAQIAVMLDSIIMEKQDCKLDCRYGYSEQDENPNRRLYIR